MIEEKGLEIMVEHFKDELLGMTSNDKELVVALKNKEVTIKDYRLKSIDEIIKEIEESDNEYV